MRLKGVHHIELSVLDYEASIEFFDRMFGWLGYASFWTLDLGYRSTYYMARFPFFHSYIGIQPAQTGDKLRHADHATGIHHVALWARSRKQVDDFHRDFLLKHKVPVSDAPAEYPLYTPGYYAVFFDDPITGIHFELSHTPILPSPSRCVAWLRALKRAQREHPEWTAPAWKEAMRRLPSRRAQAGRAE
jgi:catechol 2,3-dioxygenase-like lactoylglutathione lyase family enzyme